MSGLHRQLQEYVAIRRAMGFKMERHAKLLGQFTDHLAAHDAVTLTIEHSVGWACAPSAADPRWWAGRVRWSVVSPSICTRSIPPTRCRHPG